MEQTKKPQINLKTKKVLIVDDFFNFRLTLKNMMRSLGIMYIDDAANGEEAVRKIAARRYDIILCDYNLGPGKSGQQVLEEGKFRGHINYSSIFVMITAENTQEMVMGAMEYQPDAYLVKPFAKEVLEKRIRNIAAKKLNIKNIETAIADNDFDHALRVCDELMAQNPRNLSEIMKLKGEVLLKKADYKGAAEFYDKILQRGNVGWAQLGRGRADLMMGNYESAREIFENIIAQNDKIMPAYDYLARTLIKMNDPQEAQNVLMKATEISPRALLRHKYLGKLAYRNEDFSTAENSFKAAVEQGKNSCFKSPEDYTGLARTLVQRAAPQEGLKVLGKVFKEFPDRNDTRLHVSIAESFAYHAMNKTAEARRALTKAQKSAAELADNIPRELALSLAQAYMMAGGIDEGTAIIKNIVSSHHDDEEMLADVRTVFKEMDMAEQGEELISTTRDEIISLNNEGVALARGGKLSEAIIYFEKAAAHLPENKIINANAAHVLMLDMKEKGATEDGLARAKGYLDRVHKIDESYIDYAMLITMYRELSSGVQ
ncbi:MAG: tetratricopeptide repeat protein [Smithellaceae bacterium]